MAGAMTHVNYVSDDGNTYRAKVPAWVATLTGAAAATATSGIPKGYKRRIRYLRNTTTGKEHHITVSDVASAAWTDGFGAAVAAGNVPSIFGADTWVYEGRTGEQDKDRG